MNVLNLIQCTNLGGMEQASLRLMCGLKQAGTGVELLSLNPIGRLGAKLTEAGIPHAGLPYSGRGGWRMIPALRNRLSATKAESLLMTGHHLLASITVGQRFKNRSVLAVHFHHEGVKPNWQWQLIYRIARLRFRAITFPCDYLKNEAIAICPAVRDIAHTVRNPVAPVSVATPESVHSARYQLGLPIGVPLIGNGGWLIARKRFDVFLQVAHRVLAKHPRALFVVAGDGPEKAKLERLANELGIADRVRWLGWQTTMSPFYQAIDVLLFNSDFDAMGLTALEAMSFGVPVVSSVKSGGLKEMIADNESGRLFDTHDVSKLSAAILELLAMPERAKKLGLQGRSLVRAAGRTEPIVAWHQIMLNGESPQEAARRLHASCSSFADE